MTGSLEPSFGCIPKIPPIAVLSTLWKYRVITRTISPRDHLSHSRPRNPENAVIPPRSLVPGAAVVIRYRRLPASEQIFQQRLIHAGDGFVVTLLDSALVEEPVQAVGQVILEPGSPVIWFTYPGRWHDIGRFHLADGTFTGVYANILTPVRMNGGNWCTTDLCLDVWRDSDGSIERLDEDEFAEAKARGWLGPRTSARAHRESERLLRGARSGEWPPPHVHEWTLARARSVLAKADAPAAGA